MSGGFIGMKQSTVKKCLVALFLITMLFLICSVAFAEIKGSGTLSDPYLISSFENGQSLPGGLYDEFFYQNDTQTDYYLYTDSSNADLYICEEDIPRMRVRSILYTVPKQTAFLRPAKL